MTANRQDGLLRSWLFTPATRPDRFIKAELAGADVLMLDLEDAVAPVEKDQARTVALEALTMPRSTPTKWPVRTNAISTRAGLADLGALLDSHADPRVVILPKVKSAAHLAILDRLFTTAGKRTQLVALVETASGLSAISEIAAATPRLAAVMFGAADMAADLGAESLWSRCCMRDRALSPAALVVTF